MIVDGAIGAKIYKNGVFLGSYTDQSVAGTGDSHSTIETYLSLAPGDYVELYYVCVVSSGTPIGGYTTLSAELK